MVGASHGLRRGATRWLGGALVVLAAAAGAPPVSGPRADASDQGIPFPTSGWKTDFTKHSVPLSAIRSGGPSKDGIPAIDRPQFDTVPEAAKWLADAEPVIVFERGRDARAYPIQILIWHEIANDTVGGLPVSTTFCPLCNTAIAFDRRLDRRVLDFGTTGMLRNSDLVMYDRQTESWWQQITGDAIVGALTGKRLVMLPAPMVSWQTFRTTYPGGLVLNRSTGHSRPYGRNPYAGYDDVNSSPFLYDGRLDGRLRPMERVATVSQGGEDAAYPFSALVEVRLANDMVGGAPIVILYQPGTASPLDAAAVASGRDVGATTAFSRVVRGRTLTFAFRDGRFTDRETASTWTFLGRAVSGPLRGTVLAPAVHGNHFWFAWAAFKPKTRVWKP